MTNEKPTVGSQEWFEQYGRNRFRPQAIFIVIPFLVLLVTVVILFRFLPGPWAVGVMLVMPIAMLLIGYSLCTPIERRIADAHAEQWIVTQPQMHDELFCELVGVASEDRELVIQTRRILARMCHLPPERVRPEQLLDHLWSFADELGEGDTTWELLGLVIAETGVSFIRWRDAHRITTVAQLMRELTAHIARPGMQPDHN